MSKKIKVVDIFSGISVLGLGFSKEIFDIVLSVEIEKNACKTLELNKDKYHPNMKVLNQDILSINDDFISKYKDVDGIIGGAPCQPFSAAKGKFDPEDIRIACLFDYLRWVKIINPKWFVMENTDGLTQKDKSFILDEFISNAKSLGYNVNHKVLNAHDYGNCQGRKRIIIVGIKENLNIKYNFPKPVDEAYKKYVKDIIIPGEEVGECVYYSEERAKIMSYIPEGGNWRSLKGKNEDILKLALGANYTKQQGGMTGAYRRLSMDDKYVCPTLVTSPCQRNTMAAHPLENRPLSIKEYRRAQGIPDDYIIEGSIAQKYKYIGNAVPFELAKAIATSIQDVFYKEEKPNFKLIEDINFQLKFNI